jgi:hypothetical protein
MKSLTFSLLLLLIVSLNSLAEQSAKTEIEGHQIIVTFIPNHAFLAEYKRQIEIRKGEKLLGKYDLGVDPGGFDFVNVLKAKDKILFQSFAPWGFELDPKSSKVKSFDYLDESELEKMEFLGQFGFDKNKLLFLKAKDIKKPKLSMMKGG